MEGYIFAADVTRALGEHNIDVERVLVGEYLTSLEMVGVSLSVMWLDDELADLMSAPAEPLFGPRL
jgi:dihydroxyacetone kinase-like protein